MKEATSLPKAVRTLLIIGGSLSLVMAFIGVFIPVWPTTPFLLVSAACYARGSQRFYDWLLDNPLFGEYIRNYRDGKGIEQRHRWIVTGFLWATILVSAIFFVNSWWVRGGLGVIAIAVTVHMFLLPTYSLHNKEGSVPEEKLSVTD